MTDLRFASVRLSTGARVHYAEQGNGGGDAVLFLHGWPDSWFSFSRVLTLLPRHLRILVPDQRGFGDSDRPDGDYTTAQFAEDAVSFLDALSIERASIVGHSFGSFVARRVAFTWPERVARLVLIGTGFAFESPVMRDVQGVARQLHDPVPMEFAREFQASTAHVPLPKWFFDRVVAESLKLPARLWSKTMDGLLACDDAKDLARITAPTLLVWGEHDALFPREDQHRVLAAIPGAKLEVYPDTGHCPNWERPERLAADIQEFIAGVQRA